RDFDAELKALEDKARELKTRKVQQLGELVIAAGADQLSPDELAGALVAIAETKDISKREAWAKRGVMFFESGSRRTGSASQRNLRSAAAQSRNSQSPAGGSGSQ
ncbi:conjugal transfer protein TraD, partial [Mesorhizobium opportunistum]|uniref:conjugal transfer protein TraD n=1 Tax=Mesorhizobium opportunistum TaxID=593909 RepID=UPI003337A6F4